MKKWMAAILSVLLLITTLCACATSGDDVTTATTTDGAAEQANVTEDAGESGEDGEAEVYMATNVNETSGWIGIDMAERAFNALMEGDAKTAYELWDERLQAVMTMEDFEAEWQGMVEESGPLQRIESMEVQDQEGYIFVTSVLVCENMKLNMLTVTEEGGDRFLGFQFTPVTQGEALEKDLPEGVTEVDIIVGEGTDFELRGKLTLPAGASESQRVPGAVLINGSGASNMDEQVYAYAPFRDIAYGLAEQGIAVLRFDKRSYTFPAADYSTVQTEVVDDAVLAMELMKGRPEVDAENVYIIGHSMGGMLAPRIDLAGGDGKGFVLIASSPYNLGEVASYQAEKSIEASRQEAGEEAYQQSMANLETERGNLASITQELSEVEARSITAFGINGYYLQDMMAHDHLAELKSLKKPTLIIQGENDTQVYANHDFAHYQEELGGESWVELKSYAGLNHFFVPGGGDPNMAYEEYMTPGEFDPGAIGDIAEFILTH